ncbi:MAG: flagellar basal body-associated FliL family protein [Gemmatimonadota bacterium]|nr:flagellar basal body-associated FliL family protein [Gemmatimonadota bacterium]
MSDDAQPKEEGQEAEAPPKKGKALPLLLMLVGLGAGGAAGVLVVGPALAAPGGGDPEESAEGGSSGDHGGEGAEGEASEGAAALYQLPNVIVNPAGSPSRFLLVDLALKLSTEAASEELTAREAEARDRLLQIFGRRSVDQLSDIALRDSLKAEVADALSELLESGDVVSLFMPRFVIQ